MTPCHIAEMRNRLLWKQTAKCSEANHWRVGHSTILLKPQVMVWWNLWGWKLIDHC